MTQRGRADYWAPGDWNAQCYECGRKRKASMLKKHWQGYYVCPEHWEPRQPQDFARGVPDNQTPPWVQPMPGDLFDFDEIILEGTGTDFIAPVFLTTESPSLQPLLTEGS